MNRKITGIFSVLALSAMTFAQAPAAPAEQSAPAAATEPAAAAPAAAPVEAAAPAPDAAPAETPAESAAPVAVRGADAAAPAEQPVAPAVTAAEPVEEPAVVVAPKAVRGADKESSDAAVQRFREAKAVYYETVYTNEDGVPVRTVYVAQKDSKDTVTMDKLMGLYPMKFKIGAHGTVAAYQMAGNDWDSDRYGGMAWKVGVMSLIPLNEYTMGIKLGVLYEQAKASESYSINNTPVNFEFKQKKIDIPVMFTFKAASSRVYFDLGVEMSVPLYDKLKISYTDSKDNKVSSRTNLMDDYRSSLDWSFLFGFSIMANQYVSLDIGADLGMSDLYDGHLKYTNLNLSASSFNVGLTVYPF